MSSNYVGSGTSNTNGSTVSVACRGWSTLSCHKDSGTGTWTWEFQGVDGVWRTILGTATSITPLSFTASNMVNVSGSGSTPVFDWQIMGNPANRGS